MDDVCRKVDIINQLIYTAKRDGKLPYAGDIISENGYQKLALGRGSPRARIMVVGEYPGSAELKKGLAMVGPTGNYLEKQLRAAGIDTKKDVYITNVMTARPPYGVTPTPLALKAHKRYLKLLVDAIRPQLVLTLGKYSSNVFRCHFSTRAMCQCVEDAVGPADRFTNLETMKFLHGTHFTCYRYRKKRSFLVAPLYNPAYMLRKPKERADDLKDWSTKLRNALCLLHETPDPLPRIHSYDFQAALQKTSAAAALGLPLREEDVEWCDAESRVYSQPDWRIVQPAHPAQYWKDSNSLVFQTSNMEYDEQRNVFHAFGPAERAGGMSVHALITDFCYSFQASLPPGIKQHISRFEAELPALCAKLEAAVTEKQFKNVRKCHESTRQQCQMPRPLSLKLSLLHGKKSESECYLPDEAPDIHLNFEVSRHRHKALVAAAFRELLDSRYSGYSDRLRFFHLDFSPIQHLTYHGKIWEACWGEADLQRTRFVEPGSPDFISNADVQIILPWDALTSHSAAFEKGLSEEEKLRWSAHPCKRVHIFDTEFLSDDLKFPRATTSPMVNVCNEIHYHSPDMKINKKGQTSACEVHSFVLGFCAPESEAAARKHQQDYPPGTRLHVHHFRDELDMFMAWMWFMLDVDPEESVGHNSKRFDMSIVTARMNHLLSVRRKSMSTTLTKDALWDRYDGFVFNVSRRADVSTYIRQRRFVSRAFGERVITDVVCPGRSIMDTMEIYMRERKESSYTLNSLSTKYLKDTKNDVPYVAIPGLYHGGFHSLQRLNNYCDQDVALTGRLYHIHNWSTMSLELARATRTVSQSQLYTKGQQIRVVSVMMNVNEDLGRPWLLQTRERKSDEEKAELDGICDDDDVAVESWLLDERELQDFLDIDEEQEPESSAAEFEFSLAQLTEEELADKRNFIQLQDHEEEVEMRQTVLGGGGGSKRKTIDDDELLLPRSKRTKTACTQRQKDAAAAARRKKEEKSRFTGATVVDIIKGFHSNLPVLVDDWASLYPSLQREKNVDGSTLLYESDFLLPRYAGRIDKERDCSSPPTKAINPRTRRYEKLYYVSTKFERGGKRMGKGLIPLSVEVLITKRAECRTKQKLYAKGSVKWSVLEGGQLGYKIVANSFFGSTGVEEGQVSRPELGNSVCAFGRASLQQCLDILKEKFEGKKIQLIRDGDHMCYTVLTGGDTDSFFIQFSWVRDAEESAEFGPLSSHVINPYFQAPMRLEYEKALFPVFQIAKKRYTGFYIADGEQGLFFAKKRYIEMNFEPQEWPQLFGRHSWSVRTVVPDAASFEGEHIETEGFGSDEEFENYIGTPLYKELQAAVGQLQFPGLCRVDKNTTVGLKEWYHDDILFSGKEWKAKLGEQEKQSHAHYDAHGFDSWLAAYYNSPRYCIPWLNMKTKGRVFSRGIETVRRDSCPLTRRLMASFLRKVLIEEDQLAAFLEYVNVSRKLLAGAIPEHELICSKQYSKPLASYKNQDMPHICIIKRQLAEGKQPPDLGNRVSYFVTVQPKRVVTKGGGVPRENAKLGVCAYTPDEVIDQEMPIDYLYYYKKLVAKPMGRLLELLLSDPSKIMDPARLCKQHRRPQISKHAELARFAGMKRSQECILCGRMNTTGLICKHCIEEDVQPATSSDRTQFLVALTTDIEDLHQQMTKRLKTCQDCTNSSNPDPDSIVCTYHTCPQYVPRKKSVTSYRKAIKRKAGVESILESTPYQPAARKRRRIQIRAIPVSTQKRKPQKNVSKKQPTKRRRKKAAQPEKMKQLNLVSMFTALSAK